MIEDDIHFDLDPLLDQPKQVNNKPDPEFLASFGILIRQRIAGTNLLQQFYNVGESEDI